MAAKQQKSHLDVIITRQIRLQRIHISGQQPKAGEPQMLIAKIGDRFQIEAITARELIISESAFEYEREKAEEFIESLKTSKKAA